MNTNRPQIKVPSEPLDVGLDLLSVAIIIGTITYTLIMYTDLPKTIPIHFNFKGEADNYGHKSTILWLPVFNVGMFIVLFILNKYPHIHNYMVNITEENALKNYRFSTRIVRFTNLFIAILFSFIQYQIIESAHTESYEESLGSWFAPTIIGISILTPIILLIYNHKINKK